MGCRMSLIVHVLHDQLDKLKDNMSVYPGEQGEWFHQDARSFEERYKGHYNENIIEDYIRNLSRKRELTYDRQCRKNISFCLP